MNHYLNIRILPDPEFKTTMLMSALYNKLHKALVHMQTNAIGISFPEIGMKSHLVPSSPLGTLMRIHSHEAELHKLMTQNWMIGMRDHVQVEAITTVPNQVHYRIVSRVQVKSNPARLRRRLIKRKSISEQQAYEAIPDEKTRISTLPYVVMKSGSTGQTFKLFIEHQPLEEVSKVGEFSAYGLSRNATIPWF